MRFRSASVALLAGASLLSGPANAQPRAAGLEEHARVRLRTVRLRFEPALGAPPGECRDLGRADLEVTLRGAPLGPEALFELERRVEPTLHALLIDTSGSMVGKLDHARTAAAEYIRRLDPERDRALLMTFDESVVLIHGPTADREALATAVGGIRMGAMTSMLDALYFAIAELDDHRDRPVVVLLTDGVDSASLYEQQQIRELAEGRADLIVFTIGYQLPSLDTARSGVTAARAFLQGLAGDTDGRFFEVFAGGRLDRVFSVIREMLDNEALLTFIDPDADAPAGRVRVRPLNRRCKVHVFREDPALPAGAALAAVPPERTRLTAGPREGRLAGRRATWETSSACQDPGAERVEELLWVEPSAGGLQGCLLDVTMDLGLLYDHLGRSRVRDNTWLGLDVRLFEVPVPPPELLPVSPVDVMDDLARHALAAAHTTPRTDIRQRPAERHSRPWVDLPWVVNGRTLLVVRDDLAQALYGDPRYRARYESRRAAETRGELEALEARFRRVAAAVDEAILDQAVRLSEQGRRILERGARTESGDLARHLGAWLGDVPASRLFADWEMRRADRLLQGAEALPGSFDDAWRALRRLFFVPSYARVLGLTLPFVEPETGRIGYWRVVLPRPGWLGPRLKGARHHPEWGDLPFDLIPDLPLGYDVLRAGLATDPAWTAGVTEGGYRVSAIEYTPLGPAWRRDPRRAFEAVQVAILLSPPVDSGSGVIRVEAIVRLAPGQQAPTVEALTLGGAEPPRVVERTRRLDRASSRR